MPEELIPARVALKQDVSEDVVEVQGSATRAARGHGLDRCRLGREERRGDVRISHGQSKGEGMGVQGLTQRLVEREQVLLSHFEDIMQAVGHWEEMTLG